MMHILAVGMLDVATFGMDAFFVQLNDRDVRHYEVHRDGRVIATTPDPQTYDDVMSSVEKFGHCYLCESPVALPSLDALPSFLGRFAITSDTRCRYLD